jgi:DNA-binding CsgD family transcriptional regulator
MGDASNRQGVVGRDREIAAVLDSVEDPAIDVVLVVGAAGIGKSTLLGEVTRQGDARGWRVEHARGLIAGRTYPFAPFLHLLDPTEPSERAVDDLQRLLLRLGASTDRAQSVLVVDDVHHLDDGSIVLLHQVSATGRTTLVGSTRDLAGAPEELVAVAASPRGRIIDVGPLDREASDALVATIVAAPPKDLCERVWERARGSPLFTRELVRGSIETGSLVAGMRGWQLLGELAPSDRLVDLLRHRLDHQPEDARLVIRSLALVGSLPPRVVELLAGADEIDRLARAGLVRWDRSSGDHHDARLALAHDLYATVARDELAPTTRLVVIDRLVGAVRAAGVDEPDELMLLAHLLLDLGVSDAPIFLAAAEVAMRRYDDVDALRLAEAALDAGGGLEAEALRAAALGRTGRTREAIELFDDLWRRAEDPALRVSIAYRHASHLLQECSDPEAAALVLDRAVAELPTQWCAPLVGYLASLHFFTGNPRDAIEAAEPLVQGELVPPEALPGLLSSWVVMGRPAEVLAMAGRAWTEPSPRVDTHLVVLNLVWNRLVALWQVGGLADFDEPLQGLPRARVQAFESSWTAESMRASLAALRGHLDESVDRYQPLEARLRSTMVQVGVFNLALLVTVQSMRGEILMARTVLDMVEAFPPSASAGFRWWVERAEVAWRAGLGDLDAARTTSIRLADDYAEEQFHVTTSLHDVVRFGAARSVVPQLAAQAERPGATWWDRVCHEHAVAAAADDVDALLAVAGEFERGGLELNALEAFSQASRLAAADPQRWSSSAAAAAMFGVTRLQQRCGRVRTPATVAAPAGITPRELTVARMAAAGLSNSEIGTQLGTSVRTVGNQLQRVFDRLGVHSRHALAEVLEPST